MIKIPLLEHWLGRLQRYELDDAADRLSYYATAFLFAFFALTTCGKLYLGAPMQCWGPAEWPDRWRDYARDYCFAKNTYYVPIDVDLPKELEHRKKLELGYYQWVPLMLAVQALAFYLPSAFWQLLCWQAGMDAAGVVRQSVAAAGEHTAAKRRERAGEVAAQIAELIGVQRTVGARACRLWPCMHFGRVRGIYLSAMYLLIKLLYLANALFQLYVINSFLGTGNALWGWQMLVGMLWPDESATTVGAPRSPYFPIATMCDLEIRELGNTHNWSVQCVIMANIFHEKIYLFLWFWLVAVVLASVCAFICRIFDTVLQNRRLQFVCKHIRLACATGSLGVEPDRKAVAALVRDVLRPDGVMILRFVATQAGDVACADVCAALWKMNENRLPPLFGGLARAAPEKSTTFFFDRQNDTRRPQCPSSPGSSYVDFKSPLDGTKTPLCSTRAPLKSVAGVDAPDGKYTRFGARDSDRSMHPDSTLRSYASEPRSPPPPQAGYEGFVEAAPASGPPVAPKPNALRARHHLQQANKGDDAGRKLYYDSPF